MKQPLIESLGSQLSRGAAVWSYYLGDTGQQVQHMQAGIVSTTARKWLQLTY